MVHFEGRSGTDGYGNGSILDFGAGSAKFAKFP